MENAKQFNADDLMKAQRLFMENWLGMVQDIKGEAGQIGQWQQFSERMMKAGQAYFEMAQRFANLSNDNLTVEQICQDWINQMSTLFTQMMNQPSPSLDDIMKDSQIFSLFSPFGSIGVYKFNWDDLSRFQKMFQAPFEDYLSIPSLGYSRESQDDTKQFMRLMLAYQTTLNAYNKKMGKVGLEALAAFQLHLVRQMNQEEGEMSLKKIYDIWVKSADEVYGAYVVTEPYAVVYGELINAQMAVKKQASKIIDGLLENFNIPTRKEMNSLSKMVHDIRSQNNSAVFDDIEVLKRQVADLQDQLTMTKDTAQKTKKEVSPSISKKATPLKKQNAKKSEPKKAKSSNISARKSSPKKKGK